MMMARLSHPMRRWLLLVAAAQIGWHATMTSALNVKSMKQINHERHLITAITKTASNVAAVLAGPGLTILNREASAKQSRPTWGLYKCKRLDWNPNFLSTMNLLRP